MHRGVVNTPLPKHLVDQAEGAAVGIVGDHDVVAGPEHRPQCAVGSGHSRAEGPPEPALLDRGQDGFQGRAGRIAGTGVLESAPQAADTVLGERAAGVDRGIDGPRSRVRAVAGVDRLGGEAESAVCVSHRSRA